MARTDQMLPLRGSCPNGTEGVATQGVARSWAPTPSGASRHLPLRGRI
jgi:hypothetical protein